jgi:hypothetical protein
MSHASHGMSEEYNYDIHTVKCGAALSVISGKLSVYDAGVHRTAQRCRVDGSTGPGEPTAAVALLVQLREPTPPVTD